MGNTKSITKERLALLKKWGFGTIKVKGQEENSFVLKESTASNDREFTVIVRSSFLPFDMKYLQLASERLLATGNSSAAEAWAARCKLYIYEDVGNTDSCVRRFLDQQIKLAKTLSPSLAELLAIGGKNEPLSEEEMNAAIRILQDPDLSSATLKFCDHITRHYSFKAVLEGALKRSAWHHCIPSLMEVEANGMDDEFKFELVEHFKDLNSLPKVVTIKNLPTLTQRIHLMVQEYLNKEKSWLLH